MEKTGNDRLLIQLQVRQNDGNTKRMNDIRLTGLAHLSLVGVVRNVVRLLNHRNVRGWMIFSHTGDQLLVELLRARKILHRLHCPVDLRIARIFQVPV